ncbi:hypothetical protein FisN_19Lh271 [Fistulifera solaris]|uniref:Uncharacterized protein n=1 Tax=Fistulifera solaris TaxID=1519565 RepID=A0A1Z5K7I3_FISSO|nr:hypothetical protein FisN_19Lh271 [Fistulifera solaris]|eukprot:GAX22207.1 hypothetical protein FisN_19Lh271 [Fistulifera solaris]
MRQEQQQSINIYRLTIVAYPIMLSIIVQNPEGTFVAVLFVITAWPYFTKSWNDWRKEQFLRNHPSVILVSKPLSKDVWPTRLVKCVYRNAQNWVLSCCRVVLSILATILRMLTIWFTSKPAPETTKPVASPPAEPEPLTASPQPVATRVNAPTSVLKRRGERRRSMEPRVTFTEAANGKVATSYYYYNPSQQSNQKAAMNDMHTPAAAQRTSRHSTPYPLAKQPPPKTQNDETPNAFRTLDKENLPKLYSYKNHSPGQRQMRAAMAPVTSALRKRRIELENLAIHASDKKRRIPMGTHSAAVVNPHKRRERQLLVWEHLNKKSKKEELLLKDDALTALPSSDTATQVLPLENAASASFAPPVNYSLTPSQNNALPNGSTEEPTANANFQFRASATSDSSKPSSSFHSGSTASAPTSTIAPSSFPPQSTFLPKENTQSTPSLGFQIGALTTYEATALSTAPLGSTASHSEKTSTNGFQFGSNGSSVNRKEEAMSANSSFQFGSSKPGAEAATNAVKAPTFAFGATTSAPSATETPNNSSSSFGNSLQSSTSTATFQPAFQFGSSAENTPAPGPVLNGAVPANVDPRKDQSNAAFQFGGRDATASFGMPSNNGAPDATSAPAFGAPVFGMGSPVTSNNARTRRLARRGRRVA